MAGFSEILGHGQIIEHLQNAIKLQKVSHAYILDGEEGAGKKMLARAFAQTLQCERGGEGTVEYVAPDGKYKVNEPFLQAGTERQSAGYH